VGKDPLMQAADSMLGSYEASLPPALESVVAARRLVESAASEWGIEPLITEDAALAVSELVTNAVLHAGTAVRVIVRRLGGGVRLEVLDGSNRLPVVGAERPEELLATRSMTGRGLALIAATADRWGADPISTGGKATWAEVGTGRRHAVVAEPAASRAPRAMTLMPSVRAAGVTSLTALAAEGRRVHLVGIPVRLMVESIQQLVDFQREMQVIGLDHHGSPELVALADDGRKLAEAMIELRGATTGLEEIESALSRGEDVIDVDMVVPDGAEDLFERLAELMGQAWGTVARQLLTSPPNEELAAYGLWYRDEVLSQLAGAPPRPCPFASSYS
jgi:anti-sigma regulatory factor (Ser/Thr protein kinase)